MEALTLEQLKELASVSEARVEDGYHDAVYEIFYAAMYRELGVKTEIREISRWGPISFKRKFREFRVLSGRADLSDIPIHARLQLEKAGIDYLMVTYEDIASWRRGIQ